MNQSDSVKRFFKGVRALTRKRESDLVAWCQVTIYWQKRTFFFLSVYKAKICTEGKRRGSIIFSKQDFSTISIVLPESNIALEYGCLEYTRFLLGRGMAYFQVLCQTVSVRGCKLTSLETHFHKLHFANSTWKINMEPENDGLEDDCPFQLGDFYVPC